MTRFEFYPEPLEPNSEVLKVRHSSLSHSSTECGLMRVAMAQMAALQKPGGDACPFVLSPTSLHTGEETSRQLSGPHLHETIAVGFCLSRSQEC